MSLLKWIVGGALVAAVCFFFPSLGRYVAFLALSALILTVGIVVAYRVRNPHAREMRHERSHAREHEGETRDTETGASEGLAEKARRLFPEDASIPRLSAGAALVFVAFCIYWFGIDDAISQYGFVGMGGWDILHWRAIALFWGMLGGGVWLLAGKRSAKFQSGLSIAMVALFVVAPSSGGSAARGTSIAQNARLSRSRRSNAPEEDGSFSLRTKSRRGTYTCRLAVTLWRAARCRSCCTRCMPTTLRAYRHGEAAPRRQMSTMTSSKTSQTGRIRSPIPSRNTEPSLPEWTTGLHVYT